MRSAEFPRFVVLCLVASTAWMTAQVPVATTITDELLHKDSTGYMSYDSGYTAEELIANGKQFNKDHNEFIMLSHGTDEIPPGHAPDNNPLSELRPLTWNSDAVIIGTPLLRKSALTSSHNFIFSDYEIKINSVYVSHVGTLIPDSTIVITRAGGDAIIGTSKVRAIEIEFPLFQLGEKYLFFIHKTASGSFVVNPSDAYLASRDTLKPGRNHPRFNISNYDLAVVEKEIETAIETDKRRMQ